MGPVAEIRGCFERAQCELIKAEELRPGIEVKALISCAMRFIQMGLEEMNNYHDMPSRAPLAAGEALSGAPKVHQ